MGEVNSLDASPAGDIILGCGHLDLGFVTERSCHLDQPFSIRAFTHNNTAVKVLKRSGNNLRSRCRAPVDEYNYRHVRSYSCSVCTEYCIVLLCPAPGTYHFLARPDEEIDNLDSLGDQSSGIASQVEDKILRSLFIFQVNQRLPHFCDAVLCKVGKPDIARIFVNHAVIRNS